MPASWPDSQLQPARRSLFLQLASQIVLPGHPDQLALARQLEHLSQPASQSLFLWLGSQSSSHPAPAPLSPAIQPEQYLNSTGLLWEIMTQDLLKSMQTTWVAFTSSIDSSYLALKPIRLVKHHLTLTNSY